MEPLYVAKPGGMRLFGAILYGLIALDVVLTVVLLVLVNVSTALVTLVSMLAVYALIWAILPRRYEVWPDRLRIVFPLFGWNIDYAGIETVRPGQWYEAYGFMGVRFATAPSQTVTILRHNANLITHPNLVISPAGPGDLPAAARTRDAPVVSVVGVAFFSCDEEAIHQGRACRSTFRLKTGRR